LLPLATSASTGGRAVVHPSGVEHHLFFLPSGGERVCAALYAPPSRARLGVLLCQTWGMGARTMLEWSHRFAHRLATCGIATMLPHWPGTEDSDGDPNEVTLDRLVEAGTDSILAASERCDVPSWGLAGYGMGAAAAALIAHEVRASRLALIQPQLDLVAAFAEAERSARRAQLGNAVFPDWVFGHPHPPGLRRPEDVARIRGAIESYSGKGAVVRYRRPVDGIDVPGFRVVTVWGDSRRPPRLDHGPLAVAATRWLRRSVSRGR
jgi:hypothetical protein